MLTAKATSSAARLSRIMISIDNYIPTQAAVPARGLRREWSEPDLTVSTDTPASGPKEHKPNTELDDSIRLRGYLAALITRANIVNFQKVDAAAG